MTPEELEALIAKRLYRKHKDELVLAEVTSAFAALNVSEKALVVDALKVDNERLVGRIIQKAVNDAMKVDAAAEAAAMMADNSLDQTELERIFG